MNGIAVETSLGSIAQERSISRRKLLWDVARTTAATSIFGMRAFGQSSRPSVPARKLVVVTFGGGARDEETFAREGQRYIPRILGELIP